MAFFCSFLASDMVKNGIFLPMKNIHLINEQNYTFSLYFFRHSAIIKYAGIVLSHNELVKLEWRLEKS